MHIFNGITKRFNFFANNCVYCQFVLTLQGSTATPRLPKASSARLSNRLRVDKSEDGKGLVLSKQGRKDLDRIASGSVIRKALKSLEPLKWVDKSEDGEGRVLSKQGRKDLDRIASGSVIRKALKSLEPLKWVDKSEDGKGRVLSKQGRKDLDRIASGSVIRKALKSLEPLKWVDKSEDGKGRVLSKQGRKDLDRIAADLRSTVAPTDAVVFFVEFAICAELRARMPVSTTSAPSRRSTLLPIE
ncbi:hypothetical protein PRIPAC_74821 [Pristionchus pacificus]|uniref:Ribosomal protein n=1 Tax=Pristionchus pacificus TaxID=54126 RepID=A0A2A6BFZ7_PRIPA|nr:hypothetical protein PRIPAC_74821 [Pristionchus pacificus]|eukprot:PDM64809.1 ribosomal protein [Pristionchus pacificus]